MKKYFTFLTPLISALFLANFAFANEAPLKTYTTSTSYEDVVQDMKDAITDAGLKIDYGGKISEMLERTGKDLGAKIKVYKHAEFMQFCSASLTRKMMEADPANMGVCPYIVFIYETVKKPGTVTLGYRRPIGAPGEASKKALGHIDALLDSIVKEAAGKK